MATRHSNPLRRGTLGRGSGLKSGSRNARTSTTVGITDIMRIVRVTGIVLFVAGVAAGCSATPERNANVTFPATPYTVVVSDQAQFTIEVRSAPDQPLQRGVGTVQYLVTDANGAVLDGLSIVVTPWMPAMGHGASVQPTVTAEGQGKYTVNNVYFFMPGTWELRTDLVGSVTDHAVPTFDVP